MSLAFSTSSSETVLPRVMDKMERIGCPKGIVSFVIPIEFLAHQVDDIGKGFKCCLSVEECQSSSASNDINGSLSIFMANSIANLAIDKRV